MYHVIQDYVINGQGYGDVGQGMHQVRYDPGYLRPYIDRNGKQAVTVNLGRFTVEKGVRVPLKEHITLRKLYEKYDRQSPVANATLLSKESWIQLDQTVIRAARWPLTLFADLMANSPYSGFDGMSKMILEHQTMSDPGEAFVDMNALTPGRQDAPVLQLQGTPLPITHSDFSCDSRFLSISRNSGMPFDTTMAEAAARRVAESVETTAIGTRTGITYGGSSTYIGGYGRASSVYGLLNFPARLTYTGLTAPTAGSWSPAATQTQVNTILNTLRIQKFTGPFMIYTSTDWDPYLDGDYYVSITSGAVAPTKTLRSRIKEISGVRDIKRLDYLFGTQPSSSIGPGTQVDITLKPYTMIFVQLTPNVIQAVNGLDITTVQWQEKGGMEYKFKIMCIQLARMFADYYGNCGVLQASVS